MENSILTSTKKMLGLAESYDAFDLDIIIHINSVFSVIAQLGVGPDEGFMIEDASAEWSDFEVPQLLLNLIRTYVFLKVRSLFDPPTLSFLIEAQKEQASEYEYRISTWREWLLNPVDPMAEV